MQKKFSSTQRRPSEGLRYDIVDVLDYTFKGEKNLVAKITLPTGIRLESRILKPRSEELSLGGPTEERTVWEHETLVYQEEIENEGEGNVVINTRTYKPGTWEKEIEKAAIQTNTA